MRRLLLLLLALAALFSGAVAAANLGIPPLVITREGSRS